MCIRDRVDTTKPELQRLLIQIKRYSNHISHINTLVFLFQNSTSTFIFKFNKSTLGLLLDSPTFYLSDTAGSEVRFELRV